MANKSTSHTKKILDPLFPIPVEAENEFAHSTTQREVPPPEVGVGVGDVRVGVITEEKSVYYLSAPESFIIYDQVLRRGPGGQQVVDIIIETEEVFGATDYEIQIAKV